MKLTNEQALQQGIVAHRKGDLRQAERLYRLILRSQSNHPHANHNLGLIAVAYNQFGSALPLFKLATEAIPELEQFWISYIGALIEDGQFDSAKEAIGRAEQSAKLCFATASFMHAEIDRNMGRLEEAAAGYSSVLELEPTNINAYKQLGLMCLRLGRFHEAESSFRAEISLNPNDAEAVNNLGCALEKLGHLEEAAGCFRRAITFRIGFANAHQNLSSVLRKMGKTDEATDSDRYVKLLKPASRDDDLQKNPYDNSAFRSSRPVEYPAFYRPGMGTENVGGFLRAMAQMLRPNNILEVGAGYTTPFLLEALLNNERVYDDGNLDPSYFDGYVYNPKLVVIDDMSLGELSKRPGMQEIISSAYTDFVIGKFEGKAKLLRENYNCFDFVWFDCGAAAEYKSFMDEYWDICSGYIFFHFTYSDGSPNELHEIILNSMTGNPSVFDIVEPHKNRQGSITMVRKR